MSRLGHQLLKISLPFVCIIFLFGNSLTLVFAQTPTAGNAPGGNGDQVAFNCRWAEQPLTIDGVAEEVAWKHAEVIDRFYLPWLRENVRPARTATKARLLWDRQFLYFFAEMEDSDLYADIKQHDGETWNNDVFELFFKPAKENAGYYEFQVNAAGTTMDMFLPRRNSGGFRRFISDREFHIDAKVKIRGTLKKWQDTDKGWDVEGRIPWSDFLVTGGRPAVNEKWAFALCRYDYSVDFEGPELSTCAPLKSKRFPDFHYHEDYASLVFRGPEMKRAARALGIQDWSPVTTSRVVGSPEPPLPFTTKRALPNLRINYPIFMMTEPVNRHLYVIDQPRPYAPTRLCRTKGSPAASDYEVLHKFDSAVAYSLCFHPEFAKNGYVYVGANAAWKTGEPKQCRVIRYTIGREPPYPFLVNSATTIIEWESDGHNGAAMAFGLDGMMYVTTGDGTSDSDDNIKGQGLDHLLAKVLRIDVDHPDANHAYSVPEDNPFVGQAGIVPETWAYGLRNPWRITVDPQKGHVWVGNNGQDLWEQVYRVEKGANYGWSVYEGSHPFYPNRKMGPHPLTKPTVEHPHSESRSLTGGVVYYGSRLPELRGAYIYGDHSTGKIWGVKHDGENVTWSRELADTPFNITAFALDAEGELLIADHRGDDEGGFYTLVPNVEPAHDHTAFPRKLSESGLFAEVNAHQMAAGLIPYSVNSPLWSDGAFKARWIALPTTTTENGKEVPAYIEVSQNRGWSFPDQTVLVKSFGLEMTEGDAESRRWIETRFLTKQEGEWVGYSYAWNDDQTEGFLVEREGRDQEFKIRAKDGAVRTQNWRYPSRTECMTCHSRAAKYVLGLTTLQMNKDHDYGHAVENQLSLLERLGVLRLNWKSEMLTDLRAAWEQQGLARAEIDKQMSAITSTRDQRAAVHSTLLTKPPHEYDSLVNPYDSNADLDLRARSYLHANCSACHVKAGGGNAQMELEFNTDRTLMNVFDVEPLHHRFGIDGARLVAPGAPDRSVLLQRVAIRGRGQMPQLATSIADKKSVALLEEWIRSMKKE
jgi:uncharacterized repeat protein (TIGR03806 family)